MFGLGDALSKSGINALTFTYTGAHSSEGILTYAGALVDIKAAIEFLATSDLTTKYQVDTSRIVLIGHCYGGAMALNYAARHPEIQRVIALEPVQPGEFAKEYLRNPRMAAMMDSSFDALKRPNGPINFRGKQDLEESVQNSNLYDLILNAPKLSDRDILLVTGWDDPVTTTEAHHLPFYRTIKKAGASQIRLVAFHTNHGFRGVREDLAREVIRWIVSK
jgi:pimeloyl-ACP methyl ester carboxylesterase